MNCENCPQSEINDLMVSHNDMKNPRDNYAMYLEKAKQNFNDIQLRQIYFVCAKMSIRKYHPEKSYLIKPLKSENLTKKDLNILIKKLRNQE